MDWAKALAAVASLALVACGRGNLNVDDGAGGSGGDAQGAGAGTQGAGAGATGPGSGSGSGAGTTTGPGSGVTTSGPGGSGSTSGSTGSGMTCPPFGDPCTNCASQSCPQIWCDCTNNPECTALFGCFGQCNGDPTCEEGCLAMHPNGISDVLLVSGCAGTTCNLDCNWGDPNFTPCQECIFTNCAAETNACISMPACIGLWNCFQNCPQLDLTCQANCYNTFPSGIQTLEDWLQCSNNQCSQQCN